MLCKRTDSKRRADSCLKKLDNGYNVVNYPCSKSLVIDEAHEAFVDAAELEGSTARGLGNEPVTRN
uniref:Uncharacterized protein n=1 Tax=Tetranychus urticae TaxID=32264 RepID=T1KUD8_TETUR